MPNIRRRTAVVCVANGQLLAIELEDPATRRRFWSVPGGAIEPGETPERAAVRETLEETGYAVELFGEPLVNRYVFRWNGEPVQCETHWYAATRASGPPRATEDESYLLNVAWLPWPASRELFSHHPVIAGSIGRLARNLDE